MAARLGSGELATGASHDVGEDDICLTSRLEVSGSNRSAKSVVRLCD